MKSLILVIILFGLFSCKTNNAIKIRKEVSALANKIASDKIVYGPNVGYGGQEPKQWVYFLQLRSLASENELIKLTENSNPVIRCYAFKALVMNKSSKAFEILFKHLTDNSKVDTFYGCIQDTEFVADEFFGNYKSYYFPSYTPLSETELSALEENEEEPLPELASFTLEEVKKIEHEMIFNPNIKMYAKKYILSNLSPKDENYSRIRQIVIIEKNPGSIVALAKFRKPQDKKLILKWVVKYKYELQNYGIKAVYEYPDKVFFKPLMDFFYKDGVQESYFYSVSEDSIKTLLKYPRKESLDFLNLLIQCKDREKYQNLATCLYIEIKKCNDNYFLPILDKIKLDEIHLKEVDDYFSSYKVKTNE
jgi:hypothetical protein